MGSVLPVLFLSIGILTMVTTMHCIAANEKTQQVLITALATEYELKLCLGPLTYCVSVLVTFGTSLVVGLMVARKNREINMTEALKGAE